MAWTSNRYYANWKQRNLEKTFYLVDTKNQRIIDKQVLRIDTIEYANRKISGRGLRWMCWLNAFKYSKESKVREKNDRGSIMDEISYETGMYK